ncbi:MAG: PHP domain-containing protein [Ruminococcaceae bacterium]|nr:PHP domain-containing protein [Oscillospiraceae bacterium]
MKKYLFDTHIHTKEASSCSRVWAADIVKRYKELGYDGLCITDHFSASQFARHGSTYEEQVQTYLSGYRAAKEFEDENFHIILGMELRFLENENDYLVYGFDEEFVLNNDLTQYNNPEEFRPVIEANNLIMFQAHPFRIGMAVINPELLDGVEVYNGHGDHNSSNDVAYKWAEKYNLRKLSGSDFHGNTSMEPGGVYFDEYLTDSKQVAKALREGKYELKIFTK